MPTPTIEIGKTYQVQHLHKGRMTMQITYQDAIWVSGHLVTLYPDEVHVSDKELTIRKDHCKFEQVGEDW